MLPFGNLAKEVFAVLLTLKWLCQDQLHLRLFDGIILACTSTFYYQKKRKIAFNAFISISILNRNVFV